MKEQLRETLEVLENKDLDTILELLPSVLKRLTSEEKSELLANLLCNEWHTNTHIDFIKSTLKIYEKSLLE